jgi:hypothetical protein
MHVEGSRSSNRRLPMKGNNKWGGGLRVVGNSSFSGRMLIEKCMRKYIL